MNGKKYPPKVTRLLERNGFFNLSITERKEKHKQFIKSVPTALSSDEKLDLIKILEDTRGGLLN